VAKDQGKLQPDRADLQLGSSAEVHVSIAKVDVGVADACARYPEKHLPACGHGRSFLDAFERLAVLVFLAKGTSSKQLVDRYVS
jgi:hypothetical protein